MICALIQQKGIVLCTYIYLNKQGWKPPVGSHELHISIKVRTNKDCIMVEIRAKNYCNMFALTIVHPNPNKISDVSFE